MTKWANFSQAKPEIHSLYNMKWEQMATFIVGTDRSAQWTGTFDWTE